MIQHHVECRISYCFMRSFGNIEDHRVSFICLRFSWNIEPWPKMVSSFRNQDIAS